MANWVRAACANIGIDYERHKRRIKNLPKKRRLSFISLHYLFLIAMGIIFSVCIYAVGGIAYIDALFFASGAVTQSGLNTVDVNTLYLSQQILIYLPTFLCTPIFINSCVVFARIYWFNKRFKDVVREALSNRQSRTRSFSRSIGRESVDTEGGQGVNGRHITVLRNSLQPVDEAEGLSEKRPMSTVPESTTSSDSSVEKRAKPTDNDESQSDVLHSPRAIKFPDETQAFSAERHISFLERQRNESDTKPLRIPGPREADKGAVPEEVETRNEDQFVDDEEDRPHGILKNRTESQSHSIRPNVTIEEPQRPLHSSTTEGRTGHRRVPSNPYAFRAPTAPNDNDGTSTLRKRRTSMSSLRPTTSGENQGTVAYLSWQPTVGRNSLFIDLTDEQRDELGGIEYRALKTLAKFLAAYYIGFHVLGVIILVPWILRDDYYGQIIDADGQNRAWWGIFSAATFFNDLGFTLTPDSFISFQLSWLVMLLGSFLIVIGNTGFPCMLRFVIWLASICTSKDSPLYEELRFLLDHPRRCFTLLFPSGPNWVLFAILVILNGLDLIFFVILDLNDPTITVLPPAYKFLDGLFQAFSTRTAGTACVNVADLHPGIQVSYLIMMYISVFPLAISMRRTNVYEEQSLGIYGGVGDENNESDPSYVGAHLRRQLSFDLWFIFMGLFIIAIAEGDRIADNAQPAFTLFGILFEIVSAYGTVGLSLGYPNINASFSAEFSVVSKLVIIAMQIRGRHRGLPNELDRAILLPSESLHRKEQEEGERVLRRASTLNLESLNTGDALSRFPTHRTTTTHPDEDAHTNPVTRTTISEAPPPAPRLRNIHEIIDGTRPDDNSMSPSIVSAANPVKAGRKVFNAIGNFAKPGPKDD